MSYVVNNHLNNLYVHFIKAVECRAWKKNPNLINVGPTSILAEARVI